MYTLIRYPLITYVFCLLSALALNIEAKQVTNYKISASSPACKNVWKRKQVGANVFNHDINEAYVKALREFGINFVRIAFDKFATQHRDFLFGNCDNYIALVDEDLVRLKATLDIFAKYEIKVIVTFLSLPGSRWRQNNYGNDDLRIWKEEKFRKQAVAFWKDLARALQGHPAIVGYNILNEPHPQKLYKNALCDKDKTEIALMLHDFYTQVVQAIRLIDDNITIVLDSSDYASPEAFEYFYPINDDNVVYSFHMYEPQDYTNRLRNNGKVKYPNNLLNKSTLQEILHPVLAFQKKHNIPSDKIFVGEFGANRLSLQVEIYLKDLVSIFNEANWHRAFFAFRQDGWSGMDYELVGPLNQEYWRKVDASKKGELCVIEERAKLRKSKKIIQILLS